MMASAVSKFKIEMNTTEAGEKEPPCVRKPTYVLVYLQPPPEMSVRRFSFSQLQVLFLFVVYIGIVSGSFTRPR